jgi:hypothetical protein
MISCLACRSPISLGKNWGTAEHPMCEMCSTAFNAFMPMPIIKEQYGLLAVGAPEPPRDEQDTDKWPVPPKWGYDDCQLCRGTFIVRNDLGGIPCLECAERRLTEVTEQLDEARADVVSSVARELRMKRALEQCQTLFRSKRTYLYMGMAKLVDAALKD